MAIETELGGSARLLAGFENHGGRTHLGPGAEPLGRVVKGFGNNGADGLEGVRRENVVGTYLHGPLLPKNAWLADHLVERALGRRYGEIEPLAPLDDDFEAAAHESARRAALAGWSRPRRRGSAPAGAETAAPTARLGQGLGLDRLGRGDRRHQQLGDPVSGADPYTSAGSVFRSKTRISPRYPESISPGLFTRAIPCSRARPERGRTRPACSCGISTAMPVPTLQRSPGPEVGGLGCIEIEAGVPVVGAAREHCILLEALEADLHRGRTLAGPGQGRTPLALRSAKRCNSPTGTRARTRTPSERSVRSRSPATS